MGFNAGSFLGVVDKPIGEVIVVTNLAGAFGMLGYPERFIEVVGSEPEEPVQIGPA